MKVWLAVEHKRVTWSMTCFTAQPAFLVYVPTFVKTLV